jgi:hypothetical protein
MLGVLDAKMRTWPNDVPETGQHVDQHSRHVCFGKWVDRVDNLTGETRSSLRC